MLTAACLLGLSLCLAIIIILVVAVRQRTSSYGQRYEIERQRQFAERRLHQVTQAAMGQMLVVLQEQRANRSSGPR